MKFLIHSFHFSPFVYQQAPVAPANQAGAPDDAEAQEDAQQENQQRQNRTQQRYELGQGVERSGATPEVKQALRECLASESYERQTLVERFLHKEFRSDREFLNQLRTLEQEEQSWNAIARVQRATRRRIQELQYTTQSYMEVIPHKKAVFDFHLSEVRQLNRQDENMDRDLKRVLGGLATDRPNQRAVLSRDAAREIYLLDPNSPRFEETLRRHQTEIQSAPEGAAIFRRILASKKEEARIERQFSHLYDQLDKLIQQNISKARSLANEKVILENASRSCGIRLKAGTELEFSDPGILAILGRRNSRKITRVDVPKDGITRSGRLVDIRLGVPLITFNDGEVMPLGRFKKWVDAMDAVEKVGSLSDVEAATGLAEYGIKIEKGMALSYPRWRDGKREMQTVRIADIRGNEIVFDSPVLFFPGFENVDEYGEMRESLNFGEFVKWWHRYEVEKSVGLEELRGLLLHYNKIENRKYGLEAKENKPILAQPGETLKYPDEDGMIFRITSVDPADGVILDTGRKYTLPEFFYWVKNNHVRRLPDRVKESHEMHDADKAQRKIEEEKTEQRHFDELKQHMGGEQEKRVIQAMKDRQAGSVVESLKEAWYTTQILSLKDIWNVVKEVTEFVKRKHERRSKGRYGEVGSRLPWVFGTEFERVKQSAENEEVNKYKEAMEHWGIPDIYNTLHKTSSRDEAKACILTLVHKGEMRWDDPHFWETLNRLTVRFTERGRELHIPSPDKMPQGESGEDMSILAMNALWGKGTGEEWFGENTSKYNSMKKNFEFKFKQLENDPKGTGGPAGECTRMLKLWKSGEYVNAQEYEAMIDNAILYGKMGGEAKMFFIFAGVLARQNNDPHGETLLHIDRIGELNSLHLNRFPLLDYFTQVFVKDMSLRDEKGNWGKERKMNLEDYQRIMLKYFPTDFMNNKAGSEFSQYMWEVMLMEEEVRTRMSKGIRNAEQMDHDDAHMFIPPLAPSEIENITKGPSGEKKYFTSAGYCNGYIGFSQYVLSLYHTLGEEGDEAKKKNKILGLRDALYGYIKYDAILDNRFLRKDGDSRARLDDRHFNRSPVVDGSCTLRLHQQQMRNLIVEIGREYGEDLSWLYEKKFGVDAESDRKQQLYEQKIKELESKIDALILSDGGERALRVIGRAKDRDKGSQEGLRGIKSSQRPDAEHLAKMAASREAKELGLYKFGGHGGGH